MINASSPGTRASCEWSGWKRKLSDKIADLDAQTKSGLAGPLRKLDSSSQGSLSKETTFSVSQGLEHRKLIDLDQRPQAMGAAIPLEGHFELDREFVRVRHRIEGEAQVELKTEPHLAALCVLDAQGRVVLECQLIVSDDYEIVDYVEHASGLNEKNYMNPKEDLPLLSINRVGEELHKILTSPGFRRLFVWNKDAERKALAIRCPHPQG